MRFVVGVLVYFLFLVSGSADTQRFGAFSVDPQNGIVRLDGDIDAGSALNFRRALAAAPDAKLLLLNSDGGLVAMALLIADDVNSRKMSTLVPVGAKCYSACSLIFFAGEERQVDGKLGVHQLSSDTGNLISAQHSISDILDVLNRFETPIEVLTIMFRTPPQEMYIFSREDIERLQLNRRGRNPPKEDRLENAQSRSEVDNQSQLAGSDSGGKPRGISNALNELSAIEGYTKRADRLAIYQGLDFFGSDISALRTKDAASCAAECFKQPEQCRAFTYNADDRIVSGPNCFLKEQRGTSDGNIVAISGEFLRAADPKPHPFSMGVIDPNTALYENVDLPGGDLSSRPYASAKTAQQCRLGCVANSQCTAFTFVKRRAECWLKASVGAPRFMDGAVSGLKTYQSFEPTTISLESR